MCGRLICLVSLILVLITAGSASADLVGHWTLDDGSGSTATDSSGNGNDGILVDNPVWDIAWITGPSGGAAEFYGVGTPTGNGDYFDCGSDASLNTTGPISIALWIRPDADDPEGNLTTTAPMSKTDGSAWSWQVRYGWGQGAPEPYMSFTFNSTPRAWAHVGKKLERYEWCHIACSHDGTTLKCYLNGEETNSVPMGQFGGVGTPVNIGTDGWGCDWIGMACRRPRYSPLWKARCRRRPGARPPRTANCAPRHGPTCHGNRAPSRSLTMYISATISTM
ncbi:MAG: LamG-like jellyroll fold domain-containing protein [Planctomycetota bacterium]